MFVCVRALERVCTYVHVCVVMYVNVQVCAPMPIHAEARTGGHAVSSSTTKYLSAHRRGRSRVRRLFVTSLAAQQALKTQLSLPPILR